MHLCPRRGVGKHQGTSVVLLDPKVEVRRLRFGLATAVVGEENSRLDSVLDGGQWGWVLIGDVLHACGTGILA
jgi:hypothetical protein